MNLLLLGASGQVGRELQRSLAPLGPVRALGRTEAPLDDPAALAAAIDQAAPDVIVNAAAWTAVDAAEADEAGARRANAEAPALLAARARHLDALLVHYSTDYVFDGSGTRPWTEADRPQPLSAYGRSKLAGEEAIRASGCRHLILRTSWVHSAHGTNFARTMLRLSRERPSLRVVADQVGAPTGADLVADATAHALAAHARNPALGGTYHLAASGETSWYAYAERVIAAARAAGRAVLTTSVEPVTSAEYPTAARRPNNSRLDTARFRRTFDFGFPPWEEGVDRTVAALLAADPTTIRT